MDAAIGIIGHARTGKTTLARGLAEVIEGAGIVSFGEAVRQRAAEQGFDPGDRAVLMKLGQQWVDTDLEGYCREVLGQAGEDVRVLIIEGIRHEEVRAELEKLLGDVDFACVLLKAPYDVLVQRIAEDSTVRAADVERVLRDPTETQVDQLLLGAADLILDATEPVARNVHEVLRWLDERGRQSGSEPSVDDFDEFDLDVFDDEERAELVNAVSAEFDMLLLKEVSERSDIPAEELLTMRSLHRLLAVEFGGQLLVPGFQLSGDAIDQRVSDAVYMLSRDLVAWEILAWMISNNGLLLDAARPVDLPRDDLLDAVRWELSS
ncbi:AAA family ATPase [Amycolatopsis sp. NPDC051102]|uniref:AAA family ATPase n=1 Tax=Amycolatopsis sp. NPDC051102 TaxID=3155163 RepID=UPI0034433B25